MEKVFWIDPYQTSLETTVQSVDGDVVVFDKTIAYSESGGQESDRATVNGIEVLSSYFKDSPLIFYVLPKDHGLTKGARVIIKIDWPRRSRLMRLHFACELVLVILNRYFCKKAEGEELMPEEIDTQIFKLGAHMAENQARVDFKYEGNINELLPMICATFKKIVDGDFPIEKGFLDRETEVRYWRIPGLATVPCGGTHVTSTREIGYVSLRRKRPNKGVERIYITLDDPNLGI